MLKIRTTEDCAAEARAFIGENQSNDYSCIVMEMAGWIGATLGQDRWVMIGCEDTDKESITFVVMEDDPVCKFVIVRSPHLSGMCLIKYSTYSTKRKAWGNDYFEIFEPGNWITNCIIMRNDPIPF